MRAAIGWAFRDGSLSPGDRMRSVDGSPMPRHAWLATLAASVHELEERWSLTVAAPFQPGGQTAWVAPVRGRTRTGLVLKLLWRHPEAEHEAHALREWAGNGAVHLHAVADLDGTIALLIER